MFPRLGKYNTFTLSEEEEVIGSTFTILQKAWLQNRRYELIEELDKLAPDFEKPNEFFFQRAQRQAKIDMLTELIDIEASSNLINEEERDN